MAQDIEHCRSVSKRFFVLSDNLFANAVCVLPSVFSPLLRQTAFAHESRFQDFGRSHQKRVGSFFNFLPPSGAVILCLCRDFRQIVPSPGFFQSFDQQICLVKFIRAECDNLSIKWRKMTLETDHFRMVLEAFRPRENCNRLILLCLCALIKMSAFF